MAIQAEQIEQIKLFDWIRHNGLADICFHPANERRCSPQHGALLKRMGVTAGVPDVFVMRPTERWHCLIIELKTAKGKASPSQLKFLASMNAEGYLAKICYGADEAIAAIQDYLGIKPL